jgi:hypothetical protein
MPVDELGRRIQTAIDGLVTEGRLKPEKRGRVSAFVHRLRRREPARYEGFCAPGRVRHTCSLRKMSGQKHLTQYPDVKLTKNEPKWSESGETTIGSRLNLTGSGACST